MLILVKDNPPPLPHSDTSPLSYVECSWLTLEASIQFMLNCIINLYGDKCVGSQSQLLNDSQRMCILVFNKGSVELPVLKARDLDFAVWVGWANGIVVCKGLPSCTWLLLMELCIEESLADFVIGEQDFFVCVWSELSWFGSAHLGHANAQQRISCSSQTRCRQWRD